MAKGIKTFAIRHKRWIPRPLHPPAALIAAALTFLPGLAPAQEALRHSLAGEEAAEARKRALTGGHYNLKYGDLRLRLSSSLGVEANDNVNLREENPQEDLIIRPALQARAHLPVTDQNSLNLSLGFGYAKYLQTEELDRFFITPGSEVSFDIFAGDFAINLHDRFSIQHEAYSQPTISRTGNYSRMENVAGVEVTWDLYKAILSFGYDHVNYVSLNSGFRQQDHNSELLHARAAFVVTPYTTVGFELGAGFTDYNQGVLNDSVHYSAGAFASSRVSEYVSLRASAGYTVFDADTGGTIGDTSDANAIYAGLTVHHRAGRLLTHSLSGGRQIQLGLFSNTLDLYYIRYHANWNLLRKVSIGTPFFYESGEESGSRREDLERFGGGITMGRGITDKLSGSVGYQYLWKDSSEPGNDYTQNRVTLNFNYTF